MKTEIIELSRSELTKINGGDGPKIIVLYNTALMQLLYGIYVFARDAAEFQASLPPNLKK